MVLILSAQIPQTTACIIVESRDTRVKVNIA